MKNNLRNLLKEGIPTPTNLLRILGMLTKKVFVGPLKLSLDITNSCDMHCIMCWYHSPYLKDTPLQSLPLERFKILIKELRNIYTRTILLCGEGEPLFHPHIEEMVELCRKHSLEVEIMTNAYYLERKKTKFFKKIGLKKLIVSLHATDFTIFKKIRPLKTKEDFKRIINNLLFLKFIKGIAGKPQLFIINVISALNYHDIFKMARLAEDLNADKILFKPPTLTPDLPQYLSLSKDEKKILSIA